MIAQEAETLTRITMDKTNIAITTYPRKSELYEKYKEACDAAHGAFKAFGNTTTITVLHDCSAALWLAALRLTRCG